MLDLRLAGFKGGEKMKIKVTPPASVGFLSMHRRMIDRKTRKQTHKKTYNKAELEAGVDFRLIASRVYEFVITVDVPSANIRIEISFDGQESVGDKFSQGNDAALADFRVTTKKAA